MVAKVEAARKRVTFVYDGLEEQPKQEPVALGDLARSMWPELIRSAELSEGAIEMWQPECVSCGVTLGYHAKAGYYAPNKTLCAKCTRDNLDARLKASGISYREIGARLEDLVPPSADPLSADLPGAELAAREEEFGRYLTFLWKFAALAPGEKIDPPFAFVYGSYGQGKTAGAERALRDAITNGCSGRSIKFSSLTRMIFDSYSARQKSTKEFDATDDRTEGILRTYAGVHLLVIHEVGPDADTDHSLGLFFDFVDDRHQAMLPTIFTSNYAPNLDSLGARLGTRAIDDVRVQGLVDRISGGVRENVFCLLGPSWRGREPVARN